MKASELRIKLLTLKHHLHKLLLEFLERPDAGQYLRVGGVVLAVCLFLVLWTFVTWLWVIFSYHRDPVSYLRDYYDPLTPRFVDTSSYRTPEKDVFDAESYKEELFQLNEFNTYLSDNTPVNRQHKDPRTESCRIAAKKLRPESELASSSIVIVMFNEEISVLLRTIVSILMNTPMQSVKEIIIVDDKSDRDELGSRLDSELSSFPFVKLIRNDKREGLIRSRIIGSKAAVGKILIFLDSHVEVLQGWYTPIIDRIMSDPKTVVCPVIAAIDHTSLSLVSDKYTSLWGAWDWDMVYKWRAIPPREMQRRGFDDSQPIRTPAMAGGLFGIDKDFFFELGAYDPGMKIWGGENLELSFRIWMCGGALEINTCSFVGHIFRRSGIIQKTVTGETALQQNTKRAVEVWLDEYKEAHYLAAPGNKNVEAGDFVSRVLLRQRLKCRSFAWYLREVFPDQYRPERDYVAYGEGKGPGDVCLDSLGQGLGHQAGVWSCHGKGNNQFWKLLLSGELVNDNRCLDADGNNPRKVVLLACHGLNGNQQWFLTEEGVVKHGGSGKCLSHDGRHLIILPCDSTDPRFTWKFTGITETVQKRFYELHSKQFGYKSLAQREKIKQEAEENAKRRAQEKEAKKQEEEAARKKKEEQQLKEEEEERRKLNEAKKREEEEERELREWREEKKRRAEEKKRKEDMKETDEMKRAEAEKKRAEEEKKKAEEEKKKAEEEKKKAEEEKRKAEEEKKQRELEEMRKV